MEILLRNLTEDYCILTFEHIKDELDCCKCEQCRLDVISYALNRLKPKYVVSTRGELMAKLCEFDVQFEANVMSKLTEAAKIVKANPRHIVETKE